MESDISIRAAKLSDAEKIYALIHLHRDLLVPRSLGNIVENIDRFTVAEVRGETVGCAAFQVHPELGNAESAAVEIVSVAVRAPYRRMGIGKAIVQAVKERARQFGAHEALVLTFAPEFFAVLGFSQVPKTKVMHKLYTGCINCTKHTDPFTCPEIAMSCPLQNQ